jgi:hypothetical protein
MQEGCRLPVAHALAFRALLVVLVAGLALAVATSALGGGRQALALDRVSLVTHDVAVPSAAKPKKKPPVCKKGQKSTKRKPCRKRRVQVADSRANPPVAGWAFGFGLSQNTDGTWSLRVGLTRTVGNANETHTYLFQLAASSVTVAPDLSTLTLDTGAQLGQFGAIKLTFANPGSLAQGTAPSGCTTGTWQTRTGTLTGSVSFVADSSYFKTILEKSLPADLTANTSGTPATCGTPTPTCLHSTLFLAGDVSNASGAFNAILTNGQLTLRAVLGQAIAPAQVFHVLSVANVPTSDLTAAADASTGAVTTGGASPWFTGSLNFTAAAPPTPFTSAACGGTPGSLAPGTANGSLVAHFAAIPATTLSAGTALLIQE